MSRLNFNEKFIDHEIAELCKEYDLIQGSNKNIARIAGDFIDGLKPVQRRALYVMYLKDQGKSFRKLATISGDVFGRVHPHSPVAIEDAIVNIAQPWHNMIPLIQGEGNFGSVAGDVAGASRYIKAKLSDYAFACFFEDWKDSVVDMNMAYDEETKEPVFLPAKYPNVLLNGCLGIGYGLSSNIPCYNFREVVEATIQLMMNPRAKIVLIPDTPTGADIVETDFALLSNRGCGSYTQRCKYTIDAENNTIIITALPDLVGSNDIRERIADIKEKNGLPELINMHDLSGKTIDIRLVIRDDVNPYKFIRKLFKEVAGFEKSYPVNITVTNDYESFDWSIQQLLLAWIGYRREQKRVVISHKRTTLLSEQRTNDVKIFLMNKNNLDETVKIFRTSRNRAEIEQKLIEKYHNSEIRMDSLQARTLSNLRMIDLSLDAYEACLKRREELEKELKEVEDILSRDNGIDKVIIAELRDGIKRFGEPRRANVVPQKISAGTEVAGSCILQLTSDGMITRKVATNVEEEPIPADSNGFATIVEDDSSFVIIDETGHYSYIRVKDIPIDATVPVYRYSKQSITGNIVALLPADIDSDLCVTLISKNGQLKRMRISDMGPSKKPCIALEEGDKVIKGIVTKSNSKKTILVFTDEGFGQMLDVNTVRITSPSSKGLNGFKLKKDDSIVGCYAIKPEENQYIVYVTAKGKMRLNALEFLPIRESKHDSMVRLISLNDRDKLVAVVGCNRMDSIKVFYNDKTDETIAIKDLKEETMSSEPKKVTKKNAVSSNIVKVKLL